jgi:Rieske Fe-S protein
MQTLCIVGHKRSWRFAFCQSRTRRLLISTNEIMPETQKQSRPDSPREPLASRARGRRNFLLIFPALVCAGIASTVAAAAYRFLRPLASSTSPSANDNAAWTRLAPLSELKGEQPIMREVAVEHVAGWTSALEGRRVYVLPSQDNRVVSAVCPHEGCEVVWRARERDFLCPCHDSRFDAQGQRQNGPAQQDLAQIPSRVENGVLQIQIQPSADAEARHTVRA